MGLNGMEWKGMGWNSFLLFFLAGKDEGIHDSVLVAKYSLSVIYSRTCEVPYYLASRKE
jgi:hypothetical protein